MKDGTKRVVIALGTGFFQQTASQQAATILHELGHLYAHLFGNGSTSIRNGDSVVDGMTADERQDAMDKQKWNQDLVSANCKLK